MSSTKTKRGRSAYIFFCMKKREEVKKSIGGNPRSFEVVTELGKWWKDLKASSNDQDKEFLKSLEEEAAKDKERYEMEIKFIQMNNKFDWSFLYFLQMELSDGRCPPISCIEYFIKNSLLCRLGKDIVMSISNEVSAIESLISLSKRVADQELLVNIRSSLANSKGECTVCYTEGNVLKWPCHESHVTCEDCILKINSRCQSLPACPLCRVQTDKFTHFLQEMISAAETYMKIISERITYEDLLSYSAPHLSREMINLIATTFPTGISLQYNMTELRDI